MSHADYVKLLAAYEGAVVAYAAAVRVLIATKGASEFAQAMIAVNATHAKSEELLTKLNAAKTTGKKSKLTHPHYPATLLKSLCN
jgi:hypothetical protein